MKKEIPKQTDFSDEGSKEYYHEPSEREERERLAIFYGEKAKSASLTKGESIGKSQRKKRQVEAIIQRGRKKLGIHRKGDQEEMDI